MTTALLPTLVPLLIGMVSAGMHDHVTSYLQIQMPFTLNKSGGYEHREAFFGNPPYGGSINQPLYYADSDLCDANVDTRKGYPKRSKDDSGQMKPWPAPYILMMDRGGCSFVQKVRNAQHAGAAGVIIADNICLCSDKVCIEIYQEYRCELDEPIMMNDGTGGDISIPTMLMTKHDADIIKAEMINSGQNIQILMGWNLPHPNSHVEFELFTGPSVHISKEFQRNWKNIATKFEGRVHFTPRQYIYDGVVAKCRSSKGFNVCFNLCTNNGKYCALDPDGLSGVDIVTESLRRICIWNHYGESDGIGVKYWDYIIEFLDRCDSPADFTSKECMKAVFKKAKIDSGIIERCIRDSGGTIGNRDNIFLDLEMKAQKERSVIVLPTVFINKVALRGSLTINNVVNAICAGFLEGTEPDICDMCRQNNGICPESSSSSTYNNPGENGGGISKRLFGVTILAICSIFGGGAYIHWKNTKENRRDEVRAILSEYMPLEDGGNEDDQSALNFAR